VLNKSYLKNKFVCKFKLLRYKNLKGHFAYILVMDLEIKSSHDVLYQDA